MLLGFDFSAPVILFHLALFVAFYVDIKWHRQTTYVSACLWSLFWVGLSLLFSLYVLYTRGVEDTKIFLAAYVLEKSLSLDNVFVFLLIFQKWNIPKESQHRVLMYGILGAIIMRGLMITLGVQLVQTWHQVLLFFGGFLLLTGIYTLLKARPYHKVEVKKKTSYPKWMDGSTHTFWNKGKPTVLLAALLSIEWSDVVFAIDSVPAIFGLTQDVFLIYTSNIMAILGLRALYDVMQITYERMAYVSYAVGGILIIVGLKMLGIVTLSPMQAITTTLGILLASVVLPLFMKKLRL